MIKEDKFQNALYALQGVILQARAIAMAGAADERLSDLLDVAEMLPRLIASKIDETDTYRSYLEEASGRYRCEFVIQRFDEPAPADW